VVAGGLLLVGIASPASGGIPDPCTFADGTVTLEVQGGTAHLAVDAGVIVADGNDCGGTTTTTDQIVIAAYPGDDVQISLAGGPFAPGATAEPEGAPEIEISILGGPVTIVTIIGTNGVDRITAEAGGAGTAGSLNLNAGEDVDDGDLTFADDVVFATYVRLRGGADRFTAGGDAAFRGAVVAEGGRGSDVLQPGWGGGAYSGDGEPGDPLDAARDTFNFAWFPVGCHAIVGNDPAGFDSSIDCPARDVTLETALFEEIVGHPGDSLLSGSGADEVFRGGGGDDWFVPVLGRDVIKGGPGWDRFIGGEFNPLDVDLTTMRILGEGRKELSGIEGIFSLHDGKDVFAGTPPAGLESIGGAAGANVLDLRGSGRGVTVYTSTTVVTDVVSSVLYAEGFAIVFGSPYADMLVGGPGALVSGGDEFRGLGGDDDLDGGEGDDTLRGGEGDDVVVGGEGVDTCDGGPGFDVVSACEH
jgi:hypothetical protein